MGDWGCSRRGLWTDGTCRRGRPDTAWSQHEVLQLWRQSRSIGLHRSVDGRQNGLGCLTRQSLLLSERAACGTCCWVSTYSISPAQKDSLCDRRSTLPSQGCLPFIIVVDKRGCWWLMRTRNEAKALNIGLCSKEFAWARIAHRLSGDSVGCEAADGLTDVTSLLTNRKLLSLWQGAEILAQVKSTE